MKLDGELVVPQRKMTIVLGWLMCYCQELVLVLKMVFHAMVSVAMMMVIGEH